MASAAAQPESAYNEAMTAAGPDKHQQQHCLCCLRRLLAVLLLSLLMQLLRGLLLQLVGGLLLKPREQRSQQLRGHEEGVGADAKAVARQ